MTLCSRRHHLKLTLSKLVVKGEQKQIDAIIVKDLIRFAQYRSVSDIVLMSGDEDLIPGVEEAQNYGIRVQLLIVEGFDKSVSRELKAIADGFNSIEELALETCVVT